MFYQNAITATLNKTKKQAKKNFPVVSRIPPPYKIIEQSRNVRKISATVVTNQLKNSADFLNPVMRIS